MTSESKNNNCLPVYTKYKWAFLSKVSRDDSYNRVAYAVHGASGHALTLFQLCRQKQMPIAATRSFTSKACTLVHSLITTQENNQNKNLFSFASITHNFFLEGGGGNLLILYTLLSLSGKFWPPYWVRLQQPQEQRYPVLQVHAGYFCVSKYPSNSDVDYRIFNVHKWLFLWVHISTGGGAHTDNQSVQHFRLGKTPTNLSCASDGVWTSGLWASSRYAVPTDPPCHPLYSSMCIHYIIMNKDQCSYKVTFS